MRILHAIHDFLPRHRAGSEIYAYHLAGEQQRRGHRVTVLCAEYDPSREHASVSWRFFEPLPVVEVVNNWVFSGLGESYRSETMNRTLGRLLEVIDPHVLHLHSLLNLSFDLPRLAAERGIPSVATLHDFTLVCPSGGQRVHLAEQHVCTEIDPERCARCFPQSPFHAQMVFGRAALRGGGGIVARLAGGLRRRWPTLASRLGGWLQHAPTPGTGAPDIEARLGAFREVARGVDRWVAPSRALADDFVRFGLPEDRLEVSDYGFPPLPEVPRDEREGPLRIGFVGTLVWHKGVHVLLEAVRRLPRESFVLHLFGDPDTFPDYSRRLRELAEGLPVVFEGRFESERVAEVYARIDTLVVSSLWPENSPLVIHEAAQAGVPVVGSRIGGTVDLVRHEIGGLLYEPYDPDALAAALRRLILEPELLRRFRDGLPEVKSLEQDAAEWLLRYERARVRPIAA